MNATRAYQGWGRTAPSTARPVGPDQVVDELREGPRGVIGRGLGRAYGDAAQCGGGAVVESEPSQNLLALDTSGRATVPAGARLVDLLPELLERGRFMPVVPGTKMITVGGAVAADIHGKNHHHDGSFGNFVRRIRLVTGDGALLDTHPTGDGSDLFWATLGGMGLTGYITEVEFDTHPVASPQMLVDTERPASLDALMASLKDADAAHRYSVAWIDLLARGRSMGRGVLTAGDHDPEPSSTPGQTRPRASARVAVPVDAPSRLLNRLTVRAFNELWFRKAPAKEHSVPTSIDAFFFPLDIISQWNRLYGAPGFLQYQMVIPDGHEDTLERMVDRLSAEQVPTFLAVLKRFGPANRGHLSFPIPGWTLALDMPARLDGLDRLLDAFDEWVADAGGRVYLAKDSRLRPTWVPIMYPRLAQWQEVRDRYHGRRFVSDLARRLDLQ